VFFVRQFVVLGLWFVVCALCLQVCGLVVGFRCRVQCVWFVVCSLGFWVGEFVVWGSGFGM